MNKYKSTLLNSAHILAIQFTFIILLRLELYTAVTIFTWYLIIKNIILLMFSIHKIKLEGENDEFTT